MKRTLAACCWLVSTAAAAHHGKDFLVVESYEIPHPGDAYALASGDYARDGREEESELEPSVLVGVMPRVAAEVHAHFAKGDDARGFRYEAMAPSVHAQLTDPHSGPPLSVGVSAEYELAAPEAADAFEGRLILERSVGALKLSLNGIARREAGHVAYGYAAGARLDLSEAAGVGVEGQGLSGVSEALAGLYLEPAEAFTVKLGVGTKVSAEGPDITARASLVYRY